MIDILKQIINLLVDVHKNVNVSRAQLYKEKIKWEKKSKLFQKWIYLYHYDLNIKDWLDKMNKNSVAIYGMGDLGQLLYYELSKNGVSVNYTIDQNYEYKNSEVNIYPLTEKLEQVDVVIVALIDPNDKLIKNIEKSTDSDVIKLESIIETLIEDIRF